MEERFNFVSKLLATSTINFTSFEFDVQFSKWMDKNIEDHIFKGKINQSFAEYLLYNDPMDLGYLSNYIYTLDKTQKNEQVNKWINAGLVEGKYV